MNEELKKLKKLDTIENLNIRVQSDIARVQSRVDAVSDKVNKVQLELDKYEKKWESNFKHLDERLSKLESRSSSQENKWELCRESIAKDLKVVQSSNDDNSKKVIGLEAFIKQSEEKWVSLHTLEDKIKTAADKKFRVVQSSIKDEVKKELMVVVKHDLQQQQLAQAQAEAPRIGEGPQVSHEDLNKLKGEIMEELKAINKETPVTPAQNSLRQQAFSKRHNILIFGLTDNNLPDEDSKEAVVFFRDQMGLTGLHILATYRLGSFQTNSYVPRPLVV